MFREFISVVANATIELPATELILLIGLLAVCLVLRYTRVGLIAAYALTYRWGWQFMHAQPSEAFMGYIIMGIVVGTLAIISMLNNTGKE